MANFTNHGALETLKWVLAQTPGVPPTDLWIKLHIGDPGPDGTGNPALNDERKLIEMGTAINIGVDGRAQAASIDNVSWPSVPADETYSHISIWDAETLGAVWYYDAMLASVPVTTGGAFVFPIGQLIDHV